VALSANCGPVVIADEDATARLELALLFEAAGYDVVQAESGEEVLRAVEEATPCVVLLEIPLGSLSGYEVCRSIREEARGIRVVFVSGARPVAYDRVGGRLVGADDYVVKPYAPDELLTRVRALVRRSHPPTLPVRGKLTKRELEVLGLLADGLRQDEIAERLFISRKTVGTHVANILRKLGVHSQIQAVALAYREELLEVVPQEGA
jgi:two-component system, NarL family, nitrate/nitrite response regulator NarL